MDQLKAIYIILFVLMASILAAGCIGSDNNSQVLQSTNTTAPKPVETRNLTATQENTTVDVDTAWQENFQKYSKLIKLDAENMQMDWTSSDRTGTVLKTDGKAIVNDTQKALDENNKSTISPKYQDAQNEYVLALNDYNSAGKSLIAMADGLTYPASGDAFENFYKRSDSGERHLKKAIALFPMNNPSV